MNPHEDDVLSEALREAATRHRAPASLHRRLAASLAEAEAEAEGEAKAKAEASAGAGAAVSDATRPASAPATAAVGGRGRAWWLTTWLRGAGTFAAGALAGLLWAAFVMAPDTSAPLPLEQEVVASHVRSLMADHLMDVASTDQHTVKPWFGGKLDYSPPVRDLAAKGYPLAGARLDYLEQRPVAALVYRRQRHIINLYVWPAGAAAAGVELLSRQGYNLAGWRRDGMQYWAVSDLNARELSEFAQLLRQPAAN
jgi:anti-sigma factor RsiW